MGHHTRRHIHQCAIFGLLISPCVVAAPSVSAAAEDAGSANLTMQGCRPVSDDKSSRYIFVDYVIMQTTCTAQIDAIVDTSDKVCSPDKSTHMQAQQVVMSYIDQRPARLHERFTKLALEALVAAWPCSR